MVSIHPLVHLSLLMVVAVDQWLMILVTQVDLVQVVIHLELLELVGKAMMVVMALST